MSDNLPSREALMEVHRRIEGGFTPDAFVAAALELPHLTPLAILAAQLIEKYEKDTLVDPVVRRAREALAKDSEELGNPRTAKAYRDGLYDDGPIVKAVARALKEGTGE